MTALERARVERGLSQSALAEQADVQQATISRAESGKPIGTKPAEKLAKFFGHVVLTELQLIYPDRYLTEKAS